MMQGMVDYRFTDYFENEPQRKRPYVKDEVKVIAGV